MPTRRNLTLQGPCSTVINGEAATRVLQAAPLAEPAFLTPCAAAAADDALGEPVQVSEPELKARLVSALETEMRFPAVKRCFQLQRAPLQLGAQHSNPVWLFVGANAPAVAAAGTAAASAPAPASRKRSRVSDDRGDGDGDASAAASAPVAAAAAAEVVTGRTEHTDSVHCSGTWQGWVNNAYKYDKVSEAMTELNWVALSFIEFTEL